MTFCHGLSNLKGRSSWWSTQPPPIPPTRQGAPLPLFLPPCWERRGRHLAASSKHHGFSSLYLSDHINNSLTHMMSEHSTFPSFIDDVKHHTKAKQYQDLDIPEFWETWSACSATIKRAPLFYFLSYTNIYLHIEILSICTVDLFAFTCL